MILRKILLLTLVYAWAMQPLGGESCSTFALQTGLGTLFGRNTDGEAVPGAIIINKRGIWKQTLPWGFTGPDFKSNERVEWQSAYGSLTFSHFGREFPDGGVNEAGLIVEEMTLGSTEYPQAESLPSISVQQWIQYQLDNFSSVDEVIAAVGQFNLRGWPWHFTVADQQGRCATIEFLEGEPSINHGTLAQGCILTNDTLSDAMQELELSQSLPPASDISQGPGSLARFIRAHDLIPEGLPANYPGRRDYAFEVLGSLAQGDSTFRSVVYDLGVQKVYFRSPNHPSIKQVSLDQIDFSADSPVLALDFESGYQGDVTRYFGEYDSNANRQIVESIYDLVEATPSVSPVLDSELKAAAVDKAAFVSAIANYPETTQARRTAH